MAARNFFALLLTVALIASACGSNQDASDAAGEFADFVVQDGHEAIQAADGEPHILWFWGSL